MYAPPAPAPRLAYLVSAYPATSHTFILREVLGLRRLGFELHTASINPDARELVQLTADEREAREDTYVLKQHGLRGALPAVLWALRLHPRGLMRGLSEVWLRSHSPRGFVWSLCHLTEALMLGRWMAGQHLTHLHVHFGTAAASVASLARLSLPIRLSMTLHGPDEFANVREEHFASKVAAADFIICISHFARGQAMQHSAPEHWHKFSVVRLGVDSNLYAPPAPEARPKRPFTLLCVGRLTPAKGQHLLLEALALLGRQGLREPRLLLIGDGPDASSLRLRCAELGLGQRVCFIGARNQQEVRAYYAEADAFVLPSFAEGIPVVLMEAMASGLPCLSTRVAGIPELITEGQSGLLVAASDVAGLTIQLRRLIEDGSLRQRLAEGGRSRVQEDYELSHNIARLAGLFREQWVGSTV